ncbi:hypothetical protein JW992_04015 [candidate division KSB1 bacterium]|nr:hypothetical protein [candidate division KSB1 bacterium]
MSGDSTEQPDGSLPPAVDAEQARQRAWLDSRPRRWMFWRQQPTIRRLELLMLPLWVFPCRQSDSASTAAAVGVEALDGVSFFLDPALPRASSQAPSLHLRPRIDRDKAHDLAQQELQDAALRSRRLTASALVGAELEEPFLVGYPFWIAYLKKARRYDFLVIDGISGSNAGLRMRKPVLSALRLLENNPTS